MLSVVAPESLWRSQVRTALTGFGVNAMSFIPAQYQNGIADRTITTNLTSYLQQAIDSLPDTGGLVDVPPGRFPCAGLRIDGSDGAKVNVELRGHGWATHFRKPDDDDLTTEADKRANVIEAQNGSGFVVRDCKIEGNRSRGGVSPPFAIRWTNSTAYGFPFSSTLTTKSDGTAAASTSDTALSLAGGARTFLVLKAHTSSAGNISVDLAAGNVSEVTGQIWDEVAQTGYLPSWNIDSDYRFRHVLYLHGEDDYLTDSLALNVETSDGVYGGLVCGSGPLFATGVGLGAKRVQTIACYSHDNGGSNFGGGHNLSCVHVAPRSTGGYSSGVRFDEGCDDGTIIAPVVDGDGGALANGGVLIYKSDNCKLIAPTVRNASLAIWIDQSLLYQLVMPDADGQTISITSSTPAARGFYDAQPIVADSDGRTLTPGESGTTFSNSGASAIAPFTLPAAVNGLEYTFLVIDADGIRIIPAGDDTIRIGTSVSGVGSAGKIEATALGSVIKLRAISFTAWVAVAVEGTWTVT